MDCERIEREEIIERYLTGNLDRAEQKEFETHYFSCSKCLQKLQVSRLLQEKLWEQGQKVLRQTQKPYRVWTGRRAWVFSTAAVVLIIAVAALWWQFRGPGRPPAITKETPSSLIILARFEPPPYVPPALRGGADEATERFRLGMAHYQEGQFGGALSDLQAAAALDPGRAGIRFFLGICLILTEKTNEGIEELRKTISLGDSGYLEESHFYLAKAFLAKGDAGSAKEQLHWVLENGTRLKEDAAQILAQLK